MSDPFALHPHTETPQMMAEYAALAKDGHGHVLPRPDGTKAPCGGPQVCRTCKMEQMLYSTRERVMVVDGFNLKPGDKLLLIAPPNVRHPQDIADLRKTLMARFPEVDITVMSGFTGVQIHRQEPS